MPGQVTADRPAVDRPGARQPARSRVALALLIVYIAWGATYPAIAVLVRTVPPLLGMGARFLVAGVVLAGGLRLAGRRRPAMQRRAIVGSTLVGPWILGSIGLIAIA